MRAEPAPTPVLVRAQAAVAELCNVWLSFNEKQVLKDVSLVVRPEERLVIIGQSGAGKTTILRLLLGILTPTRGSVFFRQRDVARLSADELREIRARIGMV